MQFPALYGRSGLWRYLALRAPFRLGRKTPHGDPTKTLSDVPVDQTERLIDRMLDQGRYALLMRPELAATMTSRQCQKAQQCVRDAMTSVTSGQVAIAPWAPDDSPSAFARSTTSDCHFKMVDAFLLDRFQVSNEQFQVFVDEGGYHNLSYWTKAVRQRMSDFVDRTGTFGPRFWRDGQYPKGLASHPVVGVCWYEAVAFSRWQGKRLPTDAEWMNAACNPLTTDDGHTSQRLYPWGHEPRKDVANLWGFESAGQSSVATIAVDSLLKGATEGGIQQMLGNVWEWTSSELTVDGRSTRDQSPDVVWAQPLKSLRGGAYDTYFGEQATCHLQSGDTPFARKRNIGFRCALGASELAMDEGDDLGNFEDETPSGCTRSTL